MNAVHQVNEVVDHCSVSVGYFFDYSFSIFMEYIVTFRFIINIISKKLPEEPYAQFPEIVRFLCD